ncbi:glycolate oxidase subunit GlcF [Kaarinaea lacus]
MQTRLSPEILSTETGREADGILRRCVHCGFCNATCPTYQLLGDELDGPRGRIYLIKQFLEGRARGEVAGLHLDRCLTCRNCETTCPSGVQYGRLLEIGREQIEKHVSRTLADRLLRWVLRTFLSRPVRLRAAVNLGNVFRGLLPATLEKALPQRTGSTGNEAWPEARHERRVILLQGCVQQVIEPRINSAAAQVLDRLSISAIRVQGEGCCGALDQHLAGAEQARRFMRNNIDQWWPYIENGIEAIVSTASACGLQVKDYAYYLGDDPRYADKASRVSALARDIAEILNGEQPFTRNAKPRRVAFHPPCTLQHGQQLNGMVEGILERWGFETVPVANSHLCCGSAGTYSLLQPELANVFRDNKVHALTAHKPDVIASANIGCLQHISKTAPVPVRHWIELLAER